MYFSSNMSFISNHINNIWAKELPFHLASLSWYWQENYLCKYSNWLFWLRDNIGFCVFNIYFVVDSFILWFLWEIYIILTYDITLCCFLRVIVCEFLASGYFHGIIFLFYWRYKLNTIPRLKSNVISNLPDRSKSCSVSNG